MAETKAELLTLNVALAQIELAVGDIPGNVTRVLEAGRQALAQGAEVVVYPELTLSGYPPEDLLFRDSMQLRIESALQALCEAKLPVYLIVGFPKRIGDDLFNQAAVIFDGEILAEYSKQHLPNYQVFDEKRYFTKAKETCVFNIKGFSCGLSICEDIWFDGPVRRAKEKGVELMFNLNASPFHINRDQQRRDRVIQVSTQFEMAVVYVNHSCGQDELVFDGGSMVADHRGLQHTCETYKAQVELLTLAKQGGKVEVQTPKVLPVKSLHESLYQALVIGLRSYVNRNGFPGVVLGLSGGIDSGLSLAIAVDALGADRVEAIMMPYEYTSQMSLDDAKAEADALKVKYEVVPIHKIVEAGLETLGPVFAERSFGGSGADVTEQNLQARTRGMLLMALSNKTGKMVLTTGNKSEMAVGYATLYGDMCGGYNALKDVPKTLVFELSRYRNTLSPVIPERVIERPPSAELAPDQKDEDSLPPYETLDRIIELYVEKDWSAEAIVASGIDSDQVYRVIRLIDINEYKRRQAPEGVRVTPRGFGRDRRYPITNGWKAGE